jgi:hypothetical protein
MTTVALDLFVAIFGAVAVGNMLADLSLWLNP